MIILLDLIGNVLNHLGELGVSISNKRLLSSSLHSLERSPSCDHRLKRRAHTVLIALDGISDTPLVVVEKTELDSLEEEVCNLREETKKLRELEGKSDRQMNELKRMIESLQPTLSLQSGKTIDKDTPSLPNPKTEPFQLRIVCASNGHIFDININPGNTVLQLKQTLVPSICVPVQRMSLMNESEELADSLTVSAIDFGGNDSLILIINDSDEPPDLIPLTIRDQMNRSSTVRISPTKTVRDLKDIISLREHVRSSSVILFYYGRTLNSNSATLAECGIVADSEVVFVAHIIGGGEPAIEV
ncbi:hypothetical protein BLNAU_23479 [Blattamonas nauphoetae]|uniref:Ubiquitin-like domain-containing protein n=1 Tax=Blattamonas nauphoetae TaxID=2049346 RepID=A0ABQ9WQ39_9EUKA|nr:hypothetical protein BLNAU_23479 [Blattamonas nauphoetae]